MSDFDVKTWTDFDISELKRLYAAGKNVYEISQRLRRTQQEIIEAIDNIGIKQHLERELKDVIVIPANTNNLIKKHGDDIPDIGVLLTKIRQDTSLLHQDSIALENKIVKKIDELINAINENTALKRQELEIIRSQYEVWKEAHKK